VIVQFAKQRCRLEDLMWLRAMVLDDVIEMLAQDISEDFAEEVRSSIGKVLLEENEFASRELHMPTVRARRSLCFCCMFANFGS
jgi:hypothetical protein